SQPGWAWDLAGLLSVPVLVALNGLFVAAEFALVAVRRTRVQELLRQGRSGARAVAEATAGLDRSIAATQLGITRASIGLGGAGEPALARLLGPLFASLPAGWGGAAAHSAASVLAFALITFLHVVFGELIPKTVALQRPDGTALWVARPLVVFARLSRPLLLLMNGTGNALLRLFGYRPAAAPAPPPPGRELALPGGGTPHAGRAAPRPAPP